MAYYIGFLKEDNKHAIVFKSTVKPKQKDYSYFIRVVGPYTSWESAKDGLKRFPGYRESRVRKSNPVESGGSHNSYVKFLQYMGELERHVVGSKKYNEVMAKAYHYMKLAKVAARGG